MTYGVEKYLSRVYYGYKIQQVSLGKKSISYTKKLLKGKKRFLGLFWVNEYYEKEVVLSDWIYLPLESVFYRYTVEVAIIVDDYNEKVYWKFID